MVAGSDPALPQQFLVGGFVSNPYKTVSVTVDASVSVDLGETLRVHEACLSLKPRTTPIVSPPSSLPTSSDLPPGLPLGTTGISVDPASPLNPLSPLDQNNDGSVNLADLVAAIISGAPTGL